MLTSGLVQLYLLIPTEDIVLLMSIENSIESLLICYVNYIVTETCNDKQ
jgi:hypothetical protein